PRQHEEPPPGGIGAGGRIPDQEHLPRTVAVTVGAQELGTAAAGDVSTLPVPVSQPAPGGPAAQPHQLFSAFIGGPGGSALPSAPHVVFPTIEFMWATVPAVAALRFGTARPWVPRRTPPGPRSTLASPTRARA